MTAAANRYDIAAITYRATAIRAVAATVTFAPTPTPANAAAFEDACRGYISAQLELLDAQYDRINEVAGAGQLVQLIGDQLEAKVQVLEELATETRDMLTHLSGLIGAFIVAVEGQHEAMSKRLAALEGAQPWRNEP